MRSSTLLAVLAILLPRTAAPQNIQTIAGGGPHNLPALQTLIPTPYGVAVDSSGNVYVSVDPSQIWKIDTTGKVNVFAGSGLPFGLSGDGGAALNASLNQPTSLIFDSAGNLYISESNSYRVRKISTSGVITTVAGTGTAGFSGDSGPATSAKLGAPGGLAIDSAGNLYIADPNNNRIRVVSSTGTISTFAGNGTQAYSGDGGLATSASLSQPNGVAVDSTGAVYIGDSLNFRVRKVVSGTINTFAGTGVGSSTGDGGPATSARIGPPFSIAVDHVDNLYILDRYNVRVVLANQPNITRFAGNPFAPGYSGDGGDPANASFQTLTQIAFDSAGTNAYIADSGNKAIRKVASSVISTFAGPVNPLASGTRATDISLYPQFFSAPSTIALDNTGSLLLTDGRFALPVQKVSLTAGTLTNLAGPGNYNALAVNSNGDIYVVNGQSIGKLSNGVFTATANTANVAGFAGDGGPASSAKFNFYSFQNTKLAFASNGDLYIADANNNRIRLISAQTGNVTTIAGTGVAGTSGDNGQAINAQLNLPNSLALDGAGNLFVADSSTVRRINLKTGIISTVVNGLQTVNLDGSLQYLNISPDIGLFADQSSNLFIASLGSRVVKYNAANSLFTTVAGNGTFAFSGDGGPATSAAISPFSITGDRTQNLYISDGSGRIRSTKVSSCFFTVSSPVVYKNSNSNTGSVTITATDPSCPYAVSSDSAFATITSGANGTGSGTITFSLTANTGQNRTATVAIGGASFALTQAGTLAQSNIGLFQPSGPTWILDANGDGTFNTGDKLYAFGGQSGAIALAGDWNGDGRSKIGYYLNGFWALDYDGDGIFTSADKFYAFGGPDSTYVPVIGDWNGTGTTKIGYYRAGFWTLDVNGDGTFNAGDAFYAYGGNPGEIPLVGDWNGDHRTKIGLYYNGGWTLDYNGTGNFGNGGRYYGGFSYQSFDKPVIGDWNGTGTTKIGVFRNGFWLLDYNGDGAFQNGVDKFYAFGGNSGDMPIVGDWNADGRTKIGLYNVGFWTLDFNGNGMGDSPDRFLAFYAGTGTQPLIGRW